MQPKLNASIAHLKLDYQSPPQSLLIISATSLECESITTSRKKIENACSRRKKLKQKLTRLAANTYARIHAVKIKVKFRDSLCVASIITLTRSSCGLHLGVWCNNDTTGGKSIFGQIEKHGKRIYFCVVKYAQSNQKH